MMQNAELTVVDALNQTLHQLMAENDKILVVGQDLLDPYGGAFKVTRGLSTRFPDRIFPTPISESAIVGVSIGLAIRGFLPIAEIMFGDFMTLCADPLVNTAAKFPLMYQDVKVPIVVRVPMGGHRGYGPTHSQTLDKMYLGIPGLRLVSPSLFHSPSELLRSAVLNDPNPVLFIENKLLYNKLLYRDGQEFRVTGLDDPAAGYPVAVAENFSGGEPDAVIFAYGGTALEVSQALVDLEAEEVHIRGVFPGRLDCGLTSTLLAQVPSGAVVVIAEENTAGFNWGSEISAELYARMFGRLTHPIRRVSSGHGIIPADRKREENMLVTPGKIKSAVLEALMS